MQTGKVQNGFTDGIKEKETIENPHGKWSDSSIQQKPSSR